MAGGKETPRQKLIGLMYLVLLALLALQVSSDIMNKFLQINNSLTGFVNESKAKSGDVINNIAEKVAERGNKPAEKKALNDAQELHEKSQELLNWIGDLKDEIIIATGGTDKGENSTEGTPLGLKDGDKTSLILLGAGDKKDGKAYELKTRLDKHIDYLNEVAKSVAAAIGKDEKPMNFPKIALSGKEDPLFAKDDINIRNKDFAQLNFDHTPMVASMAFLTEKQAKVAAYEAQILEQMKGLVGASDFKFDGIVAMYKADSKTVVAGRKYEAEMFVSATSSTMAPPVMSANVPGGVKMQGSTGKISFTASAGSESVTKKTWKGSIKMQKPDGSDTTLTVEGEYFVAKPVLKVSAGDVAALYVGCANKLSVSCPALGADFKPTYSASNARVKTTAKKGEIVVYPTRGPKVSLSVSSDGQKVGTEVFSVRRIPLPSVEIRPDGKKLSASMIKKGMSPPRNISIVVIPESGFASALPSESKYRATAWSVQLARGRRPVGGAKKFSGTSGNVSDLKAKVNGEGYRMIVEVTGVARKKSTGGVEPVNEFRTNSVIQTLSF